MCIKAGTIKLFANNVGPCNGPGFAEQFTKPVMKVPYFSMMSPWGFRSTTDWKNISGKEIMVLRVSRLGNIQCQWSRSQGNPWN